MERVERRAGLRVDRVIAPPHGACSEQLMMYMERLGYVGACISAGSLIRWNDSKQWGPAFALNMTELMASGFPVVPRFPFDNAELNIRLAAYLNQPIIPMGHHADCSSGFDRLGEIATAINRLGDVVWSDMDQIFCSNYRTRRIGHMLQVQMWSRKIQLNVSSGVDELTVLLPWASDGQPRLYRPAGEPASFSVQCIGRIPVRCGEELEIICPPASPLDSSEVKPLRLSPWAATRRLLCEMRDRLDPVFRVASVRRCRPHRSRQLEQRHWAR